MDTEMNEREKTIKAYHVLKIWDWEGNIFTDDPVYLAFLCTPVSIDPKYETLARLEDEKFITQYYNFDKCSRVDSTVVIDIKDKSWLEGERQFFTQHGMKEYYITDELFEFYRIKQQKDYELACNLAKEKINIEKRNETLFKVIVISGEEYEINESSDLDLVSHIKEFLPYEYNEGYGYFSAIVMFDELLPSSEKNLAIRLRVKSIQHSMLEELGVQEEDDGTIVITKRWFDIFDLGKVRTPQVYLSDGGCLNCYGCYTALFVKLDDYELAKREYDLGPKKELWSDDK